MPPISVNSLNLVSKFTEFTIVGDSSDERKRHLAATSGNDFSSLSPVID